MSERMKLAMFVVFMASTGFALEWALDEEPDPCETYREMRQIWEESQGEFGWPRGAIKECEKQGLFDEQAGMG